MNDAIYLNLMKILDIMASGHVIRSCGVGGGGEGGSNL